MAKSKEFIPISKMTKKQKFLDILKIFGYCLAGAVGVVACVVLYVYLSGGFNPPYVPLTDWHFAQTTTSDAKDEFVMDSNLNIKLDEDGNQVFDEDGNVIFEQTTDDKGNPVYNSIVVVPNEGCTEVDATLKLTWSASTSSPLVQLVEDENVSAVNKTDQDSDDTLYYEYNIKLGKPIYIRPINQDKTGWVKFTVTSKPKEPTDYKSLSCWLYVDVPAKSLSISVNNAGKFEQEERVDDNGVDYILYNVYTSSKPSIKAVTNPTNAVEKPTQRPEGTTSFNSPRKIYYEVSNEEIASIDDFGNITINSGKEGQTFTVTSYIVAQYKDLNNLPTLQQFEDDSSRPDGATAEAMYKQALNKLCIFSNTLRFYIKPIEIKSLSTGLDVKTKQFDYNVFETGKITMFSDRTKTVSKNNYFADIVLSTTDIDQAYKQALLSTIDLYVCYQGPKVDNESNQTTTRVAELADITIDGYTTINAENFVTLQKTTDGWTYSITGHAQNNFYFIFYLQSAADYLVDYVPFKISKVDVTNISLTSNQIKIVYDAEDIDKNNKGYDLTNLKATVTPSNATFSKVYYFIEDGAYVQMDNAISIEINGITYSIVAAQQNETVNYYKIVPTGAGKFTMYAVVLKIAGDVDITTATNFGIEYYSRPITVNITKDLTIDKPQLFNATQDDKNHNIFNEMRDVEKTYVDSEEEPYKQYDYYVKVYRGGEVSFRVTYDGSKEELGDSLSVRLADGAATNIAEIAKINTLRDGEYYFSLLANSVGTTSFLLVYNNTKGEGEAKCKIGLEVLPTDLVGLDFEADSAVSKYNQSISLSFITKQADDAGKGAEGADGAEGVEGGDTAQGGEGEGATENLNKAIGYSWNSIAFNIKLNSPKTPSRDFELRTYAIPADFDKSILSKYAGRRFTETIDGVDESINSIKKLLDYLSLTEQVISISSGTDDQSIPKITVNYMERVGKDGEIDGDADYTKTSSKVFDFKFVGTGDFLLVASSTTTNICSNPILVSLTTPQINVDYGVGTNEKNIDALGEMTSIEDENGISYTTPAMQIALLGAGSEAISITSTIDGKTYDVSGLVYFKFLNETSGLGVKGKSTSKISRAKIDGTTLTVSDVSSKVTDKIVVYSDFGYINENFYVINYTPDYILSPNKATPEYYTPTKIDLFANNILSITNNDKTKLFFPQDYAKNIGELKTKLLTSLTEAQVNEMFNKYLYRDTEEGTPYYHIYCNITIDDNANDYMYTYGTGELDLRYKSNSSMVRVYFKSQSGYTLSTNIDVLPGIKTNFSQQNAENANDYDYTKPIKFAGENGKLQFVDASGKNVFNAQITDINFSSADLGDDVEVFVTSAENSISHIAQTYTKVVDYTNCLSQADYNNLSEQDKQGYKSYFVKTEDTSLEEKTYYTLNEAEGKFVAVSDLDVSQISNYYENVYSKQTYFKLSQPNYIKLDGSLVNEKYLARYYERVEKYTLTTDTQVDESKNYYILNSTSGKYELVTNKSAEQLSKYFELNVEYVLTEDATIDRTKDYYYKSNYTKIMGSEGFNDSADNDISNAYHQIVFTLKNANGSITLSTNQFIKELENTITFKFNLQFQITNSQTPNNIAVGISSANYTFRFIGISGE